MKKPAKQFPDLRLSLPLFLMFLSITGCTFSPYIYKVTAIHLHNVDNSGSAPVDDSTGPIAAKAYAIRLQFTSQLYGPNKNTDPDGGTYALASPLTALTIYSRTDFDSGHPAGASLNDYFLFGGGGAQVSSSSTIVNSLANGYILDTGQAFDSLGTSQPWQSSNYFVLMQPPATLGYRTFLINVLFADNTQLTDSISVTLQ